MAVYLVMAPKELHDKAWSYEDAEKIKFVRDGFYWLALFFPLLWLIFNRLWLALLGYVAALGIVLAASGLLGDVLGPVMVLVFSVLFASEAGALKIWSMSRKRWTQVGLINARSLQEAEERFFDRASQIKAGGPAKNVMPAAKSTLIPQVDGERVVGFSSYD